jgi:hypothetical protein
MKYLNVTRKLAAIAVVSLIFMACKKPTVSTPMGDAGQTLVKLLGGSTPATISAKPIDFVPIPMQILAVEVRRDIPNEAELNKTMVVTVKDDTAAVRAANPLYVQFPTAWYTIQTDGVKTGGQGGTFTFTFLPGEFSKSIYITIPNATLLNPSALYGLGFTVTSADAGGVLSTQKSVVVEIGAKNPYDGIYSVESGFVQRYSAPGSPEVGPLNGSLVGNPDIYMVTVGAYTCAIPPVSTTGGLFWANGSNSMVAGVDGIRVTVDPVTNLTSSLSLGNATFGNWAGNANNYDPATKTFSLAFRWNPSANIREYLVVMKFKAPR